MYDSDNLCEDIPMTLDDEKPKQIEPIPKYPDLQFNMKEKDIKEIRKNILEQTNKYKKY